MASIITNCGRCGDLIVKYDDGHGGRRRTWCASCRRIIDRMQSVNYRRRKQGLSDKYTGLPKLAPRRNGLVLEPGLYAVVSWPWLVVDPDYFVMTAAELFQNIARLDGHYVEYAPADLAQSLEYGTIYYIENGRLTEMKLHDRVITPNGLGLVQGRMAIKDQPELVIVSHDPKSVDPNADEISMYRMAPYLGGPWVLCAYLPEQVKVRE